MINKTRCSWVKSPEETIYHDTEWGLPSYDDRYLFELLTLEGAQAGLSWQTVLVKRQRYQQVFHHFDIDKVANMSEVDLQPLLTDAGIIRHKLKIKSVPNNAQCIQRIQQEYQSFSNYLWSFVDSKTINNKITHASEVPASTTLSDKLSIDLKKHGFKFIGSTICYAYMQAIGMVNDHSNDCFRNEPCQQSK